MKLVQIDFDFNGPFGEELFEARRDVAGAIADEPGLLWKIWTEDEEEGRAGGIYLFSDEQSAHAYVEKQGRRLDAPGYDNVRVRLFSVNEGLSEVTRGPL